ncbi:MAG: PepSY domain-containing protein [Bacteroidia bacterium]
MKTIIVIFISIISFTRCKKYVNACKELTELKGKEHLVDLNGINAQELIDTLSRHPELQLYKFETSTTNWVARCNVFYKDLIIFSDTYLLNKGYNTGILYASDTLRPKNITFSLEPSVSYEDAIKAAKKEVNFDHTCISYRLGIYNINAISGNSKVKNYKLVWKIEGTDKYPYAIVDANTKQVIVSDDGIRYGWLD